MQLKLPSWVSDVAVVGLIFAIGGYVARLEYGISEIKKNAHNLEKKIVALETAISIHHGKDWTDKLENKTLSKVNDLEKAISGVEKSLDKKVESLGSSFNSAVGGLNDLQARAKAINRWTQQADALIKRSRLDRFRSIAVFTTRQVDDPHEIYINKQHVKGKNFKKGDPVLLINPLPPGQQEEVVVAGFLDDPTKPKTLVQINEKLIQKLGLNRDLGEFELFVQPNPVALRWNTLEDFYQQLK